VGSGTAETKSVHIGRSHFRFWFISD